MRRRIPLLLAFAAALPLCQAQIPPFTISVSPTSAVAGTPGITLTVSGQGVTDSTVRWSGTALACKPYYIPGGPESVTCWVPASYLVSPGTAAIRAEIVAQYSNTVTFTILAPLTITTACPLPNGTVGVAYSQTLAASGGVTPYTWSISAGSLPPGLGVTGGTLSGTPTAAGTYNFTLRVTDYTQQTATKACALAIVSALSITSINPTSWTAGCPSLVLTIQGTGFAPTGTGGASQVEWSGPAAGGRLVPTYVSSTQLQVSIPDSFVTTPGTASIRVVNSAVGVSGPQYSNYVYLPIGAMAVVTSLEPAGTSADSPAFTLRVYGNYFAEGSIVQWTSPTGSITDLTTEVVSPRQLRAQVPPALITTPGTARVAVSRPPCLASSNALPFDITAPLSISTTSLPQGSVGVPYSATLTASGGRLPYTWSLVGALGAYGLAFNASTGTISGTPTQAGFISLTAQVLDKYGTRATSVSLTLTIVQTLSITTPSPLPDGTVGVAYSTRLVAAGGQPPYTWSVTVGSLPPGLSLSAASGDITGTPTSPAVFEFTVQVTDSANATVSRAYRLWVAAALGITTASPLASGVVGVAYSQTLAATGGTQPYSWAIADGSLPPGLALNPATGTIAGLPTTAGTYNFTARVTDSAKNTATKPFAVTVNPYDLAITTVSPLPGGTVGAAYSVTLAATGGRAPYRWSISSGSLPQGLSLDASTGAIRGTPTAAGTATFTAQVTDANSRSTSRSFTITIEPRPELRVSGLTDVVQPTQQPRLQVNLAAATTTVITGRLTLTFAHDAVVALADNPEVQFSTGGRAVDFTIPAGQTRAQFGTVQDVGIQVGTVAGTITVAASPIGGSIQTRIARAAPALSSVRVTRTGTGFDVEIIGYATPRQVTTATFRFTAPGVELQTPEVTVNVDSAFATWYRNSASNSFGSQFRYVQPFTVTGEASAVTSVSVTLTNATGTSSAVSANF